MFTFRFFVLILIVPYYLTSSLIYPANKNTNTYVANDSVKRGGKYLPSTGNLNVLLVFCQFPDDRYQPENKLWPKNTESINMNSWIDSAWSPNPTIGSLTHYFNEMSFNKLHFTGKTVSIITPHSRDWYLKNHWHCYEIQREVIQQLDKKLDFANYDNWTFNNLYDHINKPDGIVDLMFFIWRNIAGDYPSSPVDSVVLIQKELGIGRDASLDNGSYNTDISVDGGLRKINPNSLGGGVTLRDYFSENMFRFIIHEFGHYLEGDNSMHTGFGFWGLCSAWGIKSFVVNSYERDILGWSNPRMIYPGSPDLVSAPLRDFITTGDAYKLVIDEGKCEYFYIENHENISYWETHQLYGKIEKGIYVIRQDGPAGTQLQAIPADGRYDWTVDQKANNPWVKEKLPVFKQLNEDRTNGYHDLQFIPWSWEGKDQIPQPIHLMEDSATGKPEIEVRFNGDGKDAFKIGGNIYFNPWSNPNNQNFERKSTCFGFKLDSVNKTGVYYLDLYSNLNENDINHDAVLAPGNWTINKNTTIEKGVRFVISPGSDIIFRRGSRLIVNGTLIAKSEKGRSIIFEKKDNTNPFKAVIINGKNNKSKIENIILKNGIGIIRKHEWSDPITK